LDVLVRRTTDDGAPAFVLRDEPARRKRAQVMRESRCGLSDTLLNLADAESVVARPHQRSQYREPRLGTNGGKPERSLGQRHPALFNNHISSYIVIFEVRKQLRDQPRKVGV